MSSGIVHVRIAGLTDVGLVREHNEDSLMVVDLDRGVSQMEALRNLEIGDQGVLLLVCDGMGGAAAGEVASSMAVQGMRRALLQIAGRDPDAPDPPAKADEPKADEPKADEPKADEPKADEPKADEPKADEPKADEPKADEPKADEPKLNPDAAPAEAPKVDEPKAEEPKAAEVSAKETGELTSADTGRMLDPALMALAKTLRDAVCAVNLEIFEAACADMAKAGMGTTLTSVWLRRRRVIVAQVGDSRAYLWRAGALTQITHDQSLVNQLLDSGQITPEQAKLFEHSNVILQALGVQEDVEVLVSSEDLRVGDRVLVCSDGLVGVVSDEEIQEVLSLSADLDETAQTLIDMARAAGGPDNITVILAQLSGDLPQPGSDDEVKYRPMQLEPPPRSAAQVEYSNELSERYQGYNPPPPQPLSMASVLSMAWVLGLLVAGLVIGVLLYPRLLPDRSPLRGAHCYLKADRGGMDILLDGQWLAKTVTPGVMVQLGPGQYLLSVRDRAEGSTTVVSEPQLLTVVPGQRCALKLQPPTRVVATQTPQIGLPKDLDLPGAPPAPDMPAPPDLAEAPPAPDLASPAERPDLARPAERPDLARPAEGVPKPPPLGATLPKPRRPKPVVKAPPAGEPPPATEDPAAPEKTEKVDKPEKAAPEKADKPEKAAPEKAEKAAPDKPDKPEKAEPPPSPPASPAETGVP